MHPFLFRAYSLQVILISIFIFMNTNRQHPNHKKVHGNTRYNQFTKKGSFVDDGSDTKRSYDNKSKSNRKGNWERLPAKAEETHGFRERERTGRRVKIIVYLHNECVWVCVYTYMYVCRVEKINGSIGKSCRALSSRSHPTKTVARGSAVIYFTLLSFFFFFFQFLSILLTI